MSIPYYTLQPGSQKNALLDDDRPKYWIAGPNCDEGWDCHQRCLYICCNQCCWARNIDESRMTGRPQDWSCDSVRGPTCGVVIGAMHGGYCNKGSMQAGFHISTRPEVLVDKCYLTTYQVNNVDAAVCLDEFGNIVSRTLRAASNTVKMPAGSTLRMNGQIVCSLTKKCAGNGPMLYHLANKQTRVFCGSTNDIFNAFFDKCAGLEIQSLMCTTSCGGGGTCNYLCMRGTCSVPALDTIGYVCSCYSLSRGCATSYENTKITSLIANMDAIQNYTCCCLANEKLYVFDVTYNPSYTTQGCVFGYTSVGHTYTVDPSSRKVHSLVPTAFSSCYTVSCCGCNQCWYGTYTAAWLTTSVLPGYDELAACCYTGCCRTGVTCMIALPVGVFPNPQPMAGCNDHSNDALLRNCTVQMDANKYDHLEVISDRYYVLNGNVQGPRSRCHGMVPWPIIYDAETCIVRSFDMNYHRCQTCCQMCNDNRCYRTNCYTSGGFATITPRNTITHMWDYDKKLYMREFCLDGTPVPGGCLYINLSGTSFCARSSQWQFTYDRPNDAIIASVQQQNVHCMNNDCSPLGGLDPIVYKMPTNVSHIVDFVDDMNSHTCSWCVSSLRYGCCLAQHISIYTESGACCSTGVPCCTIQCYFECNYCIRCCTLDAARIFQATEGCYNNSISKCCISTRAYCQTGESTPQHIWMQCIVASPNTCCMCSTCGICTCESWREQFACVTTFNGNNFQRNCEDRITKSPGHYVTTWFDFDR